MHKISFSGSKTNQNMIFESNIFSKTDMSKKLSIQSLTLRNGCNSQSDF